MSTYHTIRLPVSTAQVGHTRITASSYATLCDSELLDMARMYGPTPATIEEAAERLRRAGYLVGTARPGRR